MSFNQHICGASCSWINITPDCWTHLLLTIWSRPINKAFATSEIPSTYNRATKSMKHKLKSFIKFSFLYVFAQYSSLSVSVKTCVKNRTKHSPASHRLKQIEACYPKVIGSSEAKRMLTSIGNHALLSGPFISTACQITPLKWLGNIQAY